MGFMKAWSVARGIWYGVQLDANDAVKVTAVSADFGLITETDVITTVEKGDRRTGFISAQASVGNAKTVAISAGQFAVVTCLIYTQSATLSTFKITVGSTDVLDGFIPVASSAGVVHFPPELWNGADGEDVILTITNGSGTGYVGGYITT